MRRPNSAVLETLAAFCPASFGFVAACTADMRLVHVESRDAFSKGSKTRDVNAVAATLSESAERRLDVYQNTVKHFADRYNYVLLPTKNV